MPGACQLSGNAVPAVGMREWAKPRRIHPYHHKNAHGIYHQMSSNPQPIYLYFRTRISILFPMRHQIIYIGMKQKLSLRRGFAPSVFPTMEPCSLDPFKLICHWHINTPHVARGSRGVTPLKGCTLRRPRLDDITEANSCLLPPPFQGTPLQEGGF